MRPDRAQLVHIPKTGGTSIARAFDLKDSHAAAWERRAESEERWESAFTFAIVRNPWDHAVSVYHHTKAFNGLPFSIWIRGDNKTITYKGKIPMLDQWDFIADPETRQPIVDAIFDFGQFRETFRALEKTLGRARHNLPHVHHRTYTEDEVRRAPYPAYYKHDPAAAEIVAKRSAEIIRLMGYTLGGTKKPKLRHDFAKNAPDEKSGVAHAVPAQDNPHQANAQ